MSIKKAIKQILFRLKLLNVISPSRASEVEFVNEKKRISSLPRYTEGIFSFGNERIKFPDSASFLMMYDEIIEKQIYNFNPSTDKPCIIYCGANIGLGIIYLKRKFPKASITGFEADKKIFKILLENINYYGYNDIKLINKAVWNDETTVKFFSEGADGSRIACSGDTDNLTETETTRLVQYLDKKVDLLIMDIEGAEYTVINDCKEYLRNVDNLFIEYHSFLKEKQSLHGLLAILAENNFRYYIYHNGVVQNNPFIKIGSYFSIDSHLNIFAIR